MPGQDQVNLLNPRERQRFSQMQNAGHRDFTGITITCRSKHLFRQVSLVSEVSYDGPPPNECEVSGGAEVADELVELKMRVAELETANEVQRSQATETEALLATMRSEKEKLEKEIASLKKEKLAEKKLVDKLKERLATYGNPIDEALLNEKSTAPTAPQDRPQVTRRASLLNVLQQSLRHSLQLDDEINPAADTITSIVPVRTGQNDLSEHPGKNLPGSVRGSLRMRKGRLARNRSCPDVFSSIDFGSDDESATESDVVPRNMVRPLPMRLPRRLSDDVRNEKYQDINHFGGEKLREDNTDADIMLRRAFIGGASGEHSRDMFNADGGGTSSGSGFMNLMRQSSLIATTGDVEGASTSSGGGIMNMIRRQSSFSFSNLTFKSQDFDGLTSSEEEEDIESNEGDSFKELKRSSKSSAEMLAGEKDVNEESVRDKIVTLLTRHRSSVEAS